MESCHPAGCFAGPSPEDTDLVARTGSWEVAVGERPRNDPGQGWGHLSCVGTGPVVVVAKRVLRPASPRPRALPAAGAGRP